jgi:hypothetical protein
VVAPGVRGVLAGASEARPAAQEKALTARWVWIYALLDPRDWTAHYVGRTCNPARRERAHRKPRGNSRTVAWKAELRRAGLAPELFTLQRVEPRDSPAAERRWISAGRRAGWPLTNAKGGGGRLPVRRGGA